MWAQGLGFRATGARRHANGKFLRAARPIFLSSTRPCEQLGLHSLRFRVEG